MPYDPLLRWEWEGGAVPTADDSPAQLAGSRASHPRTRSVDAPETTEPDSSRAQASAPEGASSARDARASRRGPVRARSANGSPEP
jgi:hypothetical protein